MADELRCSFIERKVIQVWLLWMALKELRSGAVRILSIDMLSVLLNVDSASKSFSWHALTILAASYYPVDSMKLNLRKAQPEEESKLDDREIDEEGVEESKLAWLNAQEVF